VENDARRRILDASIALLESEGLGAFSMREVARRAGLSHQAPYHHFGDREAILAALVEEGFRNLTEALAACRAAPSIEVRLVNQGLAYVTFALRRTGHFRLMFRPELVSLEKFPDAEQAAGEAYRELEDMVESLRPRLGRRISADRLTSLHWAIVHGLAQLLLDGPLGAGLSDVDARIAHAKSVLSAHASVLLAPKRAG
jgi:AcrR family transcriptional regulator